MKMVIAALIALSAQASVANCLGEAQIIAKVTKSSQTMSYACTAYVDGSSIVQFNESMVCPLDLSEVLSAGVQVGTKADGTCALNEGDVITGVLVKKNDVTIVLE